MARVRACTLEEQIQRAEAVRANSSLGVLSFAGVTVRPNSDDPSTWLVEFWWPPQYLDHFYAREFDFYREFGLRLLEESGPWRVRLIAPDPVVSFCEVAFREAKVAEVHINSDSVPWRYNAALTGGGSEIDTANLEEIVKFVVQARGVKTVDAS